MAWLDWDLLLHGDATGPTRADVWRWWSARRIRFNFLVGLVGFVTWWLVLIAGSAAVKPGIDFEELLAMIFGPFVFALMANICYTAGPAIDCILFEGKPKKKLFAIGLYFSMGLTALPGLWAVVAWLTTLATGRKLD
jgi:hypothetical protein